jgi:acyl-CoA dehydrogenase
MLPLPISLTLPIFLISLTLLIPFLRRPLLSTPLGKLARQRLPKISDTERAAIEAGQVWVEGEFFTGRLNWQRLLEEPYPQVPAEVQAFLDGPVEQVCQMATDWEIYQRKDLPPAVWKFLKHEKFFGMMIPQEFGGLGFSNLAYSAVMVKLASRSFTHVATVGVANSLGPAKLLLRYGTPEQKARYLPRLAIGEEIPCFALTEPQAGSDAASLTARGEVFRGDDGQLYLRLNWQKRYITLGAIATLIGLAFRLYDPDHLLGQSDDVGITCALVPRDTPGVIIDHRHDPMGVPFFNSPVVGQDVVLPIDQIIGGVAQAGLGWKMLMQTLAAGRGISFPATCTGVAQLTARVASAHSVVRQQFGLSIGRFEGVAEPLARIAALTYVIDAARLYTCGAVDAGAQPAVVSAIAKYQTTELARQIVNDGMDILGGSGICRGPRNLLAHVYMAIPIAITVEGANILTRTLMIFGQGVMRCHPYLYGEIQALHDGDWATFDRLLWGHIGAVIRNTGRSLLLGLTRGRLAQAPVSGPTAPYYRRLSWASATFAVLTDLALVRYGGTLKRHESITGRYADALSWLYLTSAVLRRFEAEGRPDADLTTVHWAAQYGLAQIQTALEGIVQNLSMPGIGWVLRPLGLLGLRGNPVGSPPSDRLSHQVAQQVQLDRDMRDRLTAGIYRPTDPTEALGRLEQAYTLNQQVLPLRQRLKAAVRAGELSADGTAPLVELAHQAGLITLAERQAIAAADQAQLDAIQVDAFTFEAYQAGGTADQAMALQPLLSDRG